MALNIKDRETEEVVRRLAKRTGRSITDAVRKAAAAELQRMDADDAERLAKLSPEQLARFRRIKAICKEASALPILDSRTDDEILGYNKRGTFD
ncbi:type II toxin-antitoxin system VapB family antitoxin [soil metagenome]